MAEQPESRRREGEARRDVTGDRDGASAGRPARAKAASRPGRRSPD